MANKIVDYYTPDDERLGDYYKNSAKLIGFDKHPFGLDQNGTLRFESKDTNSKIWQDYKKLGGSIDVIGDYNQLWLNFYKGDYSLEELMQFYREDGASLCHMVDVFSDKFLNAEAKSEFQKAIVDLESIEHFEVAKQDFLENIFLAHLNGVEDEIITKYRIEAKKIICQNFGKEAWNEFVNSIKTKHER